MDTHAHEGAGRDGECIPPRAGQVALTDQEWDQLGRSLGLSARELAILRRLMDDLTQEGIALQLGISPHTVHTHLERLYRKLGVASRCAAVVRVFEEYILQHSEPSPVDGMPVDTDRDDGGSAERVTA